MGETVYKQNITKHRATSRSPYKLVFGILPHTIISAEQKEAPVIQCADETNKQQEEPVIECTDQAIEEEMTEHCLQKKGPTKSIVVIKGRNP